MNKKLFLVIIVAVFFLNGCSLLQLPGQIIGGTFGILGKLIGFLGKLPTPPPWVFN